MASEISYQALESIYLKGAQLINQLIREEYILQGHQLHGTFSRSIHTRISKNIAVGYAVHYARIVEEGLEPQQITPKMIPGLIQYLMDRGHSQEAAKKYAVMTFAKWKKEGMPTQASKRFSQTGGRTNFIEAAFLNSDIDNEFSINFDEAIDLEYNKTKSETI